MAGTVDPRARTREVFEYLKKCAREMWTVTYKELGEAVNLPAVALGKPLGFIRDHICIPRRLSLVNFIVVQTDSRRPGRVPFHRG
jgi:hypothetical protein